MITSILITLHNTTDSNHNIIIIMDAIRGFDFHIIGLDTF